jgi:hypothetical protein
MPRHLFARSDAAKRNEAKSKREGSSYFLKKRTKKLLLASIRCGRAHRVSKSFLGSFFQKRTASFVAFTRYRRTFSYDLTASCFENRRN